MSWNPDRPPIEYLQRRVIYYRKQAAGWRRKAKNEALLRRYGKRKVKLIADSLVARFELRAQEFQNAVDVLSNHL